MNNFSVLRHILLSIVSKDKWFLCDVISLCFDFIHVEKALRQLQVDVFAACAKYFNLIPSFVSAHFAHKSNANAREPKEDNMRIVLNVCALLCVSFSTADLQKLWQPGTE